MFVAGSAGKATAATGDAGVGRRQRSSLAARAVAAAVLAAVFGLTVAWPNPRGKIWRISKRRRRRGDRSIRPYVLLWDPCWRVTTVHHNRRQGQDDPGVGGLPFPGWGLFKCDQAEIIIDCLFSCLSHLIFNRCWKLSLASTVEFVLSVSFFLKNFCQFVVGYVQEIGRVCNRSWSCVLFENFSLMVTC